MVTARAFSFTDGMTYVTTNSGTIVDNRDPGQFGARAAAMN